MTRVAVTASADEGSEMAAELVAVGLRPVSLPCVRVEPGRGADLARARAAAEEADLLVLTSPCPVGLLWPVGPMPATPVAVAGPATATQVAERGGKVVLVGEEGALALVHRLSGGLAQQRVAYPHAAGIDPRVVIALAEAGSDLVAVPVYRLVPVAPGADPVDAAVFDSPPAVEGWVLSRNLADLLVAVIGASTAAVAERHGRAPDVTVVSPGCAALARRLAGAFG